MKKLIVGILSIIIVLGCTALTACKDTPSSAITYEELIRETYAAEKEAEDDLTRTHPVEIPERAETVEVDGEEYIVLRNESEFKAKVFYSDSAGNIGSEKNYIFANDIDFSSYYCDIRDGYFKGKLNGNNYKVCGTYYTPLFYNTDGATIENVVFSASDGTFNVNKYSSARLILNAHNTTVKGCINYWQPKHLNNNKVSSVGSLIDYAINCYIEECTNYADFQYPRGGTIVSVARDGTIIRNCKNYGNLGGRNDGYSIGGIVGSVEVYTEELKTVIIEDCKNFGNIVGESCFGGIAGDISRSNQTFETAYNSVFDDAVIIRNCNNYGNIYLRKEEGRTKLEATNNYNSANVYGIGGIAGSAVKVENCKNEGNFYGFESLGKGIKVDYTGGIVGIAKEVENCVNTGTMVIQKGRAKNVGDVYGFLW